MSECDGGRRRPGTRIAGGADSPRAKREAAQPSLWDRLINDLPGLGSEIDATRRGIDGELGAERVEALLQGGRRSIEADPGLTGEQKRRLHRLVAMSRQRSELERRGIVVSGRVLREAVRRDIEALFNCERFECRPLLSDLEKEHWRDDPPALDDFPEVRRSVVNYGVPSFSGRSSRDFDRDELAREIRGILAWFEPRLKDSATEVKVALGDKTGIRIEIDGVLIMTPTPERLRLRTTINLENGMARTELEDA